MEIPRIARTGDCLGCGPTPSSGVIGALTRRGAITLGALGLVAVGAVAAPFVSGALAIEGYPSWDDVQNAKNNEATKGAEVANIQNLITQLQDDVVRTQNEAKAAADAFYAAQQAFFEASRRADDLQAQADTQAALALDAAQKAGRVAAQLYRNGGDDTSLELFFSDSAQSADDLLARLGTMDRLLTANEAVYADAITARDSAQSLSDQAVVARDERDRLQQEADQKMQASQAAADAAAAALAAQQDNLATLQAQLAALQDTTNKTVADYQAGVEEQARRDAEAERQRQAQIAAQAAADAAAGIGSGGGDGGGGGGGSGWYRPSGGWQSSGYGPRTVECGSGYCSSGFHAGVDLANGCGAGIYAAAAGRVVYAGYNGGYGNYIKIDHGGGVGTGYGHIMDGGFGVGWGQYVDGGQWIASAGNTGNSFGCHLHFEVYIWGSTTNPNGFMEDRGVSLY